MALAQYSELFWFPSGALATDVPARVFQHATNTLAPLYADAGRTTPLANPVSTSAAGRLEFWVEEGSYWVHIDSEAFEIAVGAAAQAATQQDITDEVARADAAYAALAHAARHAEGGADPVTLTQSQIVGLTVALAARLLLTGGTLTGSLDIDGGNLTVLRGDDAGGFRLRSDGGEFDFEVGGKDLYLSRFSGAGFDGAQVTLLRLAADGPHLMGRSIFGTGGFDTVHALDAATGVAEVGKKNGLANIRLAGFKDSAGAPGTGTWTAGDVVLDSAGAWHLCTAGGEPGTWT